MKIFKWSGGGFWLGAEIILFAENKEQAELVVQKKLNTMALLDSWYESPYVEEITSDKDGVIYFYNGDY